MALVVGLIVSSSSAAMLMPASPSMRAVSAPRAAVTMNDPRNIKSKNVWVNFCEDVKPGEIDAGFQYGQEIAIVNDGGTLYAMSNKMPPTSQPVTFANLLGKGIIQEPITLTKFSLKTGKPVGDWCPSLVGKAFSLLVAPSNVPVYPCRKNGKNVQVLINVNAKQQFEAKYWRGVLDAQGKVDGGYY